MTWVFQRKRRSLRSRQEDGKQPVQQCEAAHKLASSESGCCCTGVAYHQPSEIPPAPPLLENSPEYTRDMNKYMRAAATGAKAEKRGRAMNTVSERRARSGAPAAAIVDVVVVVIVARAIDRIFFSIQHAPSHASLPKYPMRTGYNMCAGRGRASPSSCRATARVVAAQAKRARVSTERCSFIYTYIQ